MQSRPTHTPAHDKKEELKPDPIKNETGPMPQLPESDDEKKERDRLEADALKQRERDAVTAVQDAPRDLHAERDKPADQPKAKDNDKADPKGLIAKAVELFQRASNHLPPRSVELENEARDHANQALALDPHILDEKEAEPKERLQREIK